MNPLELTGRARTHIVEIESPRCALHFEAVASFLAMHDAARVEGIDLQAISSYRDFDRQLLLWNRKWRGERPLYARDGTVLEHARLSEAGLLEAILSWSALPGGSRHHWGSDIDVIDAAASPEGYQVQLLPGEYAADGVFARLTTWLDRHMTRFGFFRPFGSDRGGAGVEPWHLSYAPVANEALAALSPSMLRDALLQSDLLGKQVVLERLPEIHARFILAVDSPCATRHREKPARA